MNCSACGGKLQKGFKLCPHCGAALVATVSKKKPSFLSGCLGSLVLLALIGSCIFWGLGKAMDAGSTINRTTTKGATAGVEIDKSPEKQRERQEFMQKLIANGAVQKYVQRGKHVEAWVTPTFSLLNYDDKKSFLGVMWAYYFDANDEHIGAVYIHDSRTGKRIGDFNPHTGLSLE